MLEKVQFTHFGQHHPNRNTRGPTRGTISIVVRLVPVLVSFCLRPLPLSAEKLAAQSENSELGAKSNPPLSAFKCDLPNASRLPRQVLGQESYTRGVPEVYLRVVRWGDLAFNG